MLKNTEIERRLQKIKSLTNRAEKIYFAALLYSDLNMRVIPLMQNKKFMITRKAGWTEGYAPATTDKKTIDKWFHPLNGKYAGYNIGLACGGEKGVWALDLDTKPHDGVTKFNEVVRESGNGEYPLTFTQKTPSGGFHLIFKMVDGIRSSASKIALGIDIRGGGAENKLSSHVVAFPSVIDGREYEIIRPIPPVDAPDWLVSLILGANSMKNKTFDNSIEPPLNSSDLLEKVETALKNVSPNCDYEDWLKVGMAIHNSFPDEVGITLFNDWSAGRITNETVEKYRGEREIRAKWKSFGNLSAFDERVTLRFIFALAGMKAPAEKTTNNEIKNIANEMNKFCFVNLNSNDFEICIDYGNRVCRTSVAGAKNIFANKEVTITSADGKVKRVNPIEIWLKSRNRKELDGFAFRPDLTHKQCIEQLNKYNLFHGFPVAGADKGVDLSIIIDELIGEIICNENQEYKDWVLDWIADIFQNPTDPKGSALILIGDEGTGKGVFSSVVRNLLGEYAMVDMAGEKIASRFNGFLANKLLLFIDEFSEAQGRKIQQTLKSVVTSDDVLIEDKGKDPYSAQIYARVIIATNEPMSIRGEKTSRRYFSLKVSNKRQNDHIFFGKIRQLINSKEGQETLMAFFMDREIKNNLRKVPITKHLNIQKVSNAMEQHSFLNWLFSGLLNEHLEGVSDLTDTIDVTTGWPKQVSYKEFKNAYLIWRKDTQARQTSEVKIGHFLSQMGYKKGRKMLNGKRQITLELPPIEKAKKAFANEIGVPWDEITEIMG